jgi:diguanylate cyclase (GGDEF)-like protein
LPNRVLLHDRLEQALLAGKRHRRPVALLLMDLDRFKEINDTFGHQYGDLVLEQVGRRLHGALRQSDTVARLGGDEFAVVLPNTDERGAVHAAEKVVDVLSEPFTVECHSLQIEASVGIALAPAHSSDRTTLLRQADVAMYVAKRAGSRCAVYRAEDDVHTPGRLTLVGDLRRGIESGELYLHYQPKMDLASRRITGVEALVRWQHPERGFVPPDEFIGLAETTGLIRPLTMWVLNEALAQCRAWRDAGIEIAVAVNLSPRTLQDRELVELIQTYLQRWQADPSWLELEITESAIMADADRALETLRRLHDMGVSLSIDDFGTGYSSLAYLKNLPVDEIKIDKSFILGMARNEDDAFIPQSVIDLGHNLGMQVVAEGVETQRILERLAAMGCDQAQGYHLSRPLPPDEIQRWLHGALARTA